MNVTRVQAFMDALNLDIAVERVGENETIPTGWRDYADHYRAMLSRPGAREMYFPFSVAPHGQRHLRAVEIVTLISNAIAIYEAHPILLDWCAATGNDPAEIADSFLSFETERRDLLRFFGEHYADFLELAHD